MLDRYVAQVRLLLDVLPDIAVESAFALKGGTAINLFYRDMPRLSVDIDLTWLLIGDRSSSLRDDWYDSEFAGMTRDAVAPETLLETGRRLHADIGSRLTGRIVTFLLSLHDAVVANCSFSIAET